MNPRAAQLHATVDGQIGRLIGVVSATDGAAFARPCPGREKLGDGSAGALAAHTADNYRRIAEFVAGGLGIAGGARAGHRIPRFARALGHRPPAGHAAHDPDASGDHGPGERYASSATSPEDVVGRLVAARERLDRLAELTDDQLGCIPPRGSFRFCDGERTLEEVLVGLFKHQAHQVEALGAALS